MSDILQSLNPVQKEAASCTEGPLLILAGAGSGKTRVLTHRIAYLIEEKGVNPWNIMAITFTNKAAQEMRDRVDRLVEFGAESIWVATFHSSCVRILRRYIDRLGYDNHFTIYDTDDQKSVIRKAVKELDLDPKQYREGPLLGVISAAKNEMIEPQDFETQAGGDFRMCQEAKIYKAYQKTLIDNNAVDFDDLLLLTVRLLRENRDILEAYQERLRYIMVDEYQDTNSVQFELIRLLSGKYHNLCVVGDDDQSIYKFRGADITNILSFEETFPGAKVVKLEQNYRSTNNILEAANSVIANNAHRKEKHLWSENGEGKEVSFIHYETAYGEAEDVIDKIQTSVHMGKHQYQDCAILYRTNAQSRAFEEKCIKKSVPYRLVGGVNFYQRQEIKDILAYLKTIDSGRDDLSVTRIVNVPKRGIGQVTLNKLAVYASEHGMRLFQAMEQAEQIPGIGKAADKIKGFVNQIMVFRALAKELDAAELIESILEQTGYLEELEKLEEDKAQAKRENLDEFQNKAADYYANHDEAALTDFLEEVALVADIDNMDSEADSLTLMTLHSAKGLEFPVVYMTGMEEGLFPSYMSMNSGDPGDIEEERRLCYVGITRAMQQLTLTAAKQRMVHGNIQYSAISRFVKELPQEKLDWKEETFGGLFKKGSSMTANSLSGSLFGGSSSMSSGSSFSASQGSQTAKKTNYDNVFDLKYAKAFSSPKPDSLDYKEGDRVSHIKFGKGTVLAVEDMKKDYQVTVEFDTAGVKKLFAGFAKLKKI
ncbi:MAG: DNA helicase PcrA [Firmicutes bacterium]|nr:DNA helicase PcrA [Bacillota bacterium]MDD6964409.1 DNA helicase PcrA [Bacillota bacterium]MDY4817530.1 DNA helicase PcrA [Lachnospiraceae bacterium]